MRPVFLLVLLCVTLQVSLAWAEPTKEPPKRQIVDLQKMTIEGSVPHPTTLFIRERSAGTLHELFPFRRRLSDEWLLPIVKESFDNQTLGLVDRKKR